MLCSAASEHVRLHERVQARRALPVALARQPQHAPVRLRSTGGGGGAGGEGKSTEAERVSVRHASAVRADALTRRAAGRCFALPICRELRNRARDSPVLQSRATDAGGRRRQIAGPCTPRRPDSRQASRGGVRQADRKERGRGAAGGGRQAHAHDDGVAGERLGAEPALEGSVALEDPCADEGLGRGLGAGG